MLLLFTIGGIFRSSGFHGRKSEPRISCKPAMRHSQIKPRRRTKFAPRQGQSRRRSAPSRGIPQVEVAGRLRRAPAGVFALGGDHANFNDNLPCTHEPMPPKGEQEQHVSPAARGAVAASRDASVLKQVANRENRLGIDIAVFA